MDIVFNVNTLGLEGLGPTLISLLRNCVRSEELQLWFLCSQVRKSDKENINLLLQSEKFYGTVEYIDFDAKKIFGHLRSLHGDWTTYGRLLIAGYIKNDVALYLDADLIISVDVLTLKNFEFNGSVLAAVYGSTVRWALENHFFINELNWPPETGYFNAGVILFNLKKWRESDMEILWRNLAEKYSNRLLSTDQTLLNAVCRGGFARLPSTFNNAWYPGGEKPKDAENSIIHFVGSPKPWDIMGKIIHKGYNMWNTYNTPLWKKEYGTVNRDKIKRAWEIRRSIVKHLVQKIK